MKLTFNDLERIVRLLENTALNECGKQRRNDFATAANILRHLYLMDVPDLEKVPAAFQEPPKMRYFTSVDAGGIISTLTLTNEQQVFVDQGRWKELTGEQGEEWQRTGRIVGVYEP